MKKFTLILMAFTLFFASCETTTDPINDADKDIIIVDQDITANTTWAGDKIYKVTRSIDVTNRALLTIQPGCIIKFVEDVELSIAYNDYGTVMARGTKENPIVFTSDSPKKQAGDWYGFYLYDGSEGSEFDYCIIEYAGGYSSDQAAINLRGGSAKFINCTVRESSAYGYEVRNDAEFEGFAYNTVTKTAREPILITANAIRTLGGFNHFDNNKRIELESSYLSDPGDHYWDAQPIPFYAPDDLVVGSQSSTGTNLTLAPGITIEFAPNSELEVGYSSNLGKLIAIGEANNPIVFTSSSSSPSSGDWDGIWLRNNTQAGTILDFCEVSYGGGYSYGGNIVCKGDAGLHTEIKNSTISHSGQYGIYRETNDSAPTISNNTFMDNAMGDINW